MKKILYSVLALAMAAFTFTSCEDVPMPYDDPNNNGGGNEKPELPEGMYLDQSFATSLGDFTSVSASGTLSWVNDFSSAMITGFKDFDGDGKKENQAGVTYLVGPEVDLTTATKAYITIEHAINYERGDINDNNSVLISKDYNGDVNTATWEILKYDTEGMGNNFTFVTKSVNIPAAYIGSKVVIALRHTCNESFSSTWEVKSLSIQEGEVEESGNPGGDPELPEGVFLDQNFASSLGNFTSISTSGELKWYNDFSSAMITGYQDFDGDGKKENRAGVTYLVSPEINITGTDKAHIEINQAVNYEKGDVNQNNSILISKNYNGNPATATWELLEYDTEGLNTSFTFKNKVVNIPAAYIGSKVVIALRHTCNESFSSTWEVKSLSVKAGEAGGSTGGNEGDLTAANGDFETWVSGEPNNWTTSSTAGNATLTQSTDAHGGKYSVKVGGTTAANKRLSYKEIELKAGEYTMEFYVKAATSTGGSVRPGFVPVTSGKVGSYVYAESYTNGITNTEWMKVSHTFSIPSDGTYCLVIMNSKNPGADVLIDDFTLTFGSTVIIK